MHSRLHATAVIPAGLLTCVLTSDLLPSLVSSTIKELGKGTVQKESLSATATPQGWWGGVMGFQPTHPTSRPPQRGRSLLGGPDMNEWIKRMEPMRVCVYACVCVCVCVCVSVCVCSSAVPKASCPAHWIAQGVSVLSLFPEARQYI